MNQPWQPPPGGSPYPPNQPSAPYPAGPYPAQPHTGPPPEAQWGPPPGAQWGPPPGQQWGPPQAAPTGPLTLPGWGALFAVPGVLATVIGLFALPWLSGENRQASFLDIWEVTEYEGFLLPQLYVVFLAFVAVALTSLYGLLWTLGGVRSQRMVRWATSLPGSRLTRARMWRYRLLFGSTGLGGLILHVQGIESLFARHWSIAGAGPWVVLGGSVAVLVGTLVGPRRGPGLPPT
ncbi:hypothetical protein [Saccharomonospora piscinae]|uniref:hypothetical protein n=1 Tax=Saccharomonospora piscinae TaxID=687388 RepID=UPI001FCA2A30|nr:hypothetical protein [Saccharomonospora piscinae]